MAGSRRFCNWCGYELGQGARYCTTCGHTLDEEDHGATTEDGGAVPGEIYGAAPGEDGGAVPGERYGATPGEDNGATGQSSGSEWPTVERNGSTHRWVLLLAIGAVVLFAAGGVGAGLFLLHSSGGGGTPGGNGSPSNIQPSL